MKMHSYDSLLFKRRRLQYKARMRYLKDLDYKGDVGEKNMPKKISMISAAEMDSFAIQQIKGGHGKKSRSGAAEFTVVS